MIRGVNLGGWFLLEPWMTDHLFRDESDRAFADDCVALDERGLMEALRQATREARMNAHWRTWITEEDIAWLSRHGINTVRVPFGYWMTHPEPPFIAGAFAYLE